MGEAITLDDLVRMKRADHEAILRAAHPIPREALGDSAYTGVDLSLPPLANRLLWKTFRKTFVRDPATGEIRGWNVRVEQTGWETPTVPLVDSRGKQRSFGHYRLRSARGEKFPRGWTGEDFLDYGSAGNAALDPARCGWCPLVAVNEGNADLLLGWEVFKVAGVFVPLPDFWALRREGPLDVVVDPPARPA
jgi:hypothetical protein